MKTSCFFGTRADGMIAATYEITNRCNLSCRHCMNSSGERAFPGLPLDQARQLADELYGCGVRSLYISGGEPLTYPEIDAFLRHCGQKGFKLSLATNGTLVRDHLDAIARDVGEVSISLDGLGGLHDAFRGMDGAFDQVRQALALLRGRVRLIISTVIWSGNRRHLAELAAFLEQAGVSQWNLSYLVPVGRGADGALQLRREEYAAARQAVEELRERYQGKGLLILFRRSSRMGADCLPCEGGRLILHATAQGKIAPCSWCAKIPAEPPLTAQWQPGNMAECAAAAGRLQEINRRRQQLLGYTGCPAVSFLAGGSMDADDPLNQYFTR